MKIGAIIISSVLGAFNKGVDYDVACLDTGIQVTSSTSSFFLTDRSENDDQECTSTSHWNSYGGSIFIPTCLNIMEEFKFWNGIIITRKDGPRKWKSETLFIECFYDDSNFEETASKDYQDTLKIEKTDAL